jgi:predicted secreted hydrolase
MSNWLSVMTLGVLMSLNLAATAPVNGATAEPDGFRRALPGYRFEFPRDHANHPAYKTEWWYYTGHLGSTSGENFGYQLTFFRVGVRPKRAPGRSPWRIRDLHMAHLAITELNPPRFTFFERLARGDVGLAQSDNKGYLVFNGNWEVKGGDAAHHLVARQGGWGLDLRARSRKTPVIHGTGGVSRKGDCEGCASHYYSLTRMATEGELLVGGRRVAVRGESWMDHEFGSGQAGPDLAGWDWFSVQLSNGSELMVYRLRGRKGQTLPASSGTYVAANGTTTHLKQNDIQLQALEEWRSPHSQARYPTRWRMEVPRLKLTMQVKPVVADCELRTPGSTQETYWEGPVGYSGTQGDRTVTGRGYVELTGYAGAFRARL